MSGPAVLGINTAHDAAACLSIGGRLTVAIAEERLSHRKHHEGFPERAVQYCLDTAGLPSLDALDLVVVNEYEETQHSLVLERQLTSDRVIGNPGHHLLHAHAAWATTAFAETAILILDGSGYSYGEYVRRGAALLGPPPEWPDMEEAESSYSLVDGELSLVAKRWARWEAYQPYYRFASLGHMFSMASQYIFGHMHHAGKTMGLAPYGDPGAFDPFVKIESDGITVDTTWCLDLPTRSDRPAELDRTCRNLAARVQADLEVGVLHLCRLLHEATGHRRLCISGGVGLNSVVNGRIVRETPFESLYVTPAAGDSGIAIGAAAFGHRRLTGVVPSWHRPHDFLGRTPTEEELVDAIERHSELVEPFPLDDPAVAAAADLVAGKVIGWYEGGSEFGPRALGHRSILADPRSERMRDHLNNVVKRRELFRPYAASVLGEHVDDWFRTSGPDPYMLVVSDVHAGRRTEIPAVVHIDGTCRIQTVGPGHPGRYRRLIEAFHQSTGVPLVLNTSLNIRGEAVVESPDDAIRCFLASNLDVLYLGRNRLTKPALTAADAYALVPLLAPGVSLHLDLEALDGAVGPPQRRYRTRTGHSEPLEADAFHCASHLDGTTTVAELGGRLGWGLEDVRRTLALLVGLNLVILRRRAIPNALAAPAGYVRADQGGVHDSIG
jgi:carbamoyltransferase